MIINLDCTLGHDDVISDIEESGTYVGSHAKKIK